MDPNTALEDLRDAIHRMDSYSDGVWPDDVTELVEAARALDEWLMRGGFLPDDWKRGEHKEMEALVQRVEYRCGTCEAFG